MMRRQEISSRRGRPVPGPGTGLGTWLKLLVAGVLLSLWLGFRTGDLGIDLSFAITGALIGVLMAWHSDEREPDLFHSIACTFFFTFFWMAPLLQVHAGEFPNTLQITRPDVVAANAVVALFITVYAGCRYLLRRASNYPSRLDGAAPHRPGAYAEAPWWPGVTVMVVVAALVVLVAAVYRSYLIGVIFDRGMELGVSSHVELLVKKFLFALPLLLALWTIMDRRLRRLGVMRWVAIGLAIGVLLLFKNPFNEKRNAIGPMYLVVAFAMFPGVLRSNLRVLGMFLLVIAVAFPLSSALTHTQAGVLESGSFIERGLQTFNLGEGLRSLEFDAWSQLVASMHFVADRGLSGGEQLLAALLFFVPRAWYPGKPEGSGKVVADYLIEQNQMWFDNLSAPLPAEAFLDFGWFGVGLYALVLAVIGWQCRRWQGCADLRWVVGVYTSLHMMYLMRGDLASAFAYLVAIISAVVLLPLGLQVALDWMAPGRGPQPVRQSP